ncbi:MAG: hypothetical protein M9924_21220 [Rhizobiaceae bacterium]|nr:hypothetical protein [Rhizobiaceae bacterium]
MAKPVFLIIAGPNGSGKSTFAQANSIGTRIDPDAIACQINPDNPDCAALSAGVQALRQIRDHVAAGRSFTQETTLAGRQPLRDMQAARDAGFHVQLEFISLESAARSAERVAERVAKGGHDIPADAIARRFDKIIEQLPEAASIADETTVRDNEHRDFRLVLRLRDGKTVERAQTIPKHLKDVIERLETLGRNTPKSLSLQPPSPDHGRS